VALAYLIAVPVFAQEESVTGVVTGRIVNRSPDGLIPEQTDLMLHAWDENFDEKLMLDGSSEADGTFEFADVSLDPSLLYAVMVTYDNVVYASEPAGVTDGQTELSLEIPVYESTTDVSTVSVDSQHILFNAALDGLGVAEIYVLSNTGDRTISGQAAEDDAQLSPLHFALPEGATNINFNESSSGRFVMTPGGFVDSAPLRPGASTGQVVVTYVLPYQDELTYSLTTEWPVDRLSFMLDTSIGLSIEGEGLSFSGTQNVGEGREVDVYSQEDLEPGKSINVSLTGALVPPLPAPSSGMTLEAETGPSRSRALALGGMTLGLALIAVGVWWYRRPESEEPEDAPEANLDNLVTDIALLDQAHDRGEINGAEYTKHRAQMVKQAKVLLSLPSE
jgi:hypothetical protein